MDVTRDDERPELEPPILQGLGQVVPQVGSPSALRARVLESIATRPVVKTRAVSPALWRLATAASLMLAAGLSLYTWQLRGRITSLEDELLVTRARADAADQRMANAVRRRMAPRARWPCSPPQTSRGSTSRARPRRRRRQHGRSGAVHAAWSSPHPTCDRCLRAKRINCGWSRVRGRSAPDS